MKKMKGSFLQLTDLNQQYMIGLIEGIKIALHTYNEPLAKNRNQSKKSNILNIETTKNMKIKK